MLLIPDLPDPPRHYRLVLFKGNKEWISDNQRVHWRGKAAKTRAWRLYAWGCARGALPALPAAHVIAELRFADNRRRDPNNWNPTAKACIDGLVDARVFIDDSHKYVIGPDMRIGKVVPAADVAIILHLFPPQP